MDHCVICPYRSLLYQSYWRHHCSNHVLIHFGFLTCVVLNISCAWLDRAVVFTSNARKNSIYSSHLTNHFTFNVFTSHVHGQCNPLMPSFSPIMCLFSLFVPLMVQSHLLLYYCNWCLCLSCCPRTHFQHVVVFAPVDVGSCKVSLWILLIFSSNGVILRHYC